MVTIKVSDMGRAVAFYTDTLGLERGPELGEHWAEVGAPGLRIGLHPGGIQHDDPRRHVSIGLLVANMVEAKAALSARGVTFSHDHDGGGVRQAYFTDPDGNPLYLVELYNFSGSRAPGFIK